MPRIPRLLVDGEEAVYHVISRTALDGYVLGSDDKEYLVHLIRWLSGVFFVKIFGYCIMSNHFHLLLKVSPGRELSDEEVLRRAKTYYDNIQGKQQVVPAYVVKYRERFSNLSEFVKEIKQRFSRYYNKKHSRRGYFWGDRYKSVLIEEGEALLNCLAYIELNPVRAGIVKRPEEYRWCSLAYLVATGNRSGFICTDYGLIINREPAFQEFIALLRAFIYEKGGMKIDGEREIPHDILEQERKKGFRPSKKRLFLMKIRYFSDSGILGSRAYVRAQYERFRRLFRSKEKVPKRVPGIEGVYSLKRLTVNV